jgi:hypothetical protein
MVLAAFLFGVLGVGCMPGFLEPPAGPPVGKGVPRPSGPPVTSDQVTPANTREIVRRLEEELNYAQAQEPQPARPAVKTNDPNPR